jgi:hypothetical protein
LTTHAGIGAHTLPQCRPDDLRSVTMNMGHAVKVAVLVGALSAGALSVGMATAQTSAAVTRLTAQDGAATLVRGTVKSLLGASPGLVLKDGDLIETAADARLLRIEFADRSTLELGPASRLWLGRASAPPKDALGGAALRGYLLDGWGKLGAAGAAPVAIDTPLGLVRSRGSSLVEMRAVSASVFAESGETHVVSRRRPAALAAGQYLEIVGAAKDAKDIRAAGNAKASSADAPLVPAAQPPMAWLKTVPTALKDKLAPLRERFDGKDVPVPAGIAVGYADIEPWLHAEPRVRTALLTRWSPLARDARFKATIVARMDKHPEWDRVLFPEKHEPRPPPTAPSAPPR